MESLISGCVTENVILVFIWLTNIIESKITSQDYDVFTRPSAARDFTKSTM